jgi:hypothetical protein
MIAASVHPGILSVVSWLYVVHTNFELALSAAGGEETMKFRKISLNFETKGRVTLRQILSCAHTRTYKREAIIVYLKVILSVILAAEI